MFRTLCKLLTSEYKLSLQLTFLVAFNYIFTISFIKNMNYHIYYYDLIYH
jgi:hypothetical protein